MTMCHFSYGDASVVQMMKVLLKDYTLEFCFDFKNLVLLRIS